MKFSNNNRYKRYGFMEWDKDLVSKIKPHPKSKAKHEYTFVKMSVAKTKTVTKLDKFKIIEKIPVVITKSKGRGNNADKVTGGGKWKTDGIADTNEYLVFTWLYDNEGKVKMDIPEVKKLFEVRRK